MVTRIHGALAAVVIALLVLSVPALNAAPTLSGALFQPELSGPTQDPSQFIEYSVNVSSTGSSADQGFVNVVRNDGTWVVQNMPVGYEPGSSTISTDINSSLFVDGASYQTTVSSSPLTGVPAFVSGVVQTLSTVAAVTLANDPHGSADLGAYNGPPIPPAVVFAFGNLLRFVYHTGMPDLAQGLNECYPTAAANSVTWLNNTYNLGLALTTAQIRDILKNGNHMKTDPATGTLNTNFLSGKNSFFSPAEQNRPIDTHQILGGAGNRPTIANIVAEMVKGQDVEINIAPLGRNWGHLVTLVGVFDLGALGVGIAFNDPDDGKTQTRTAWVSADGVIQVGAYAGSEIRFAFAESVVPEPGTMVLALTGAICVVAFRRPKPARGGSGVGSS